MTSRELKALEIAARMKLVCKDGVWNVPSQSGQGIYKVALGTDGASCTCEDWVLRREDCKHIIAARLVSERDGDAKAPEIDTAVLPIKKKYTRDWPAYNDAQINEKRRFRVLLADLCRGLPELPSKGGRPRVPIADVIFACVFKVYSTFSSRRFGTDLAESFDMGFVTRNMHPNKVNCYLENPDLYPVLRGLITASSLPLRSVETVFAPDSTGFSSSRFVRWYDEKYGVTRSGHDWVKVHAMCGVKTNIIVAAEIHDRDAADCPQFKPLVEATARNFKIAEVVADKAYLSRENLELVESLGATAYVPFKTNSIAGTAGTVWEKMFFYYNLHRQDFLDHYHQRSNVESAFSAVKAKFRDGVRSRTDDSMKNEVLCKLMAHNICCVIRSQVELGIEADFWGDQAKPKRLRVVGHADDLAEMPG
jgi:transposase